MLWKVPPPLHRRHRYYPRFLLVATGGQLDWMSVRLSEPVFKCQFGLWLLTMARPPLYC
jgi:hypothetical protein